MHFLFPGAKIWPIYSRWPKFNQYQLGGVPEWKLIRHWLGKPIRTKRSVTIKRIFNPQESDLEIVNYQVDKSIRKLPDAEFLRVGFLELFYKDEHGNQALGFVYDVRSVKYAVSK